MTVKNRNFTFSDGVELQKHYDDIIDLIRELVNDKIAALTAIIERDRYTNEQAKSLFKETNDAHLLLLNGETERTKARELEFKEKESHFADKERVDLQIQALREVLQALKTDVAVIATKASLKDLERISKRADLGTVLSIVSLLVVLLNLYLAYGR